MGYSISPSIMQSVLGRILGDCYFTCAISYANDILTFTKKDFDDHLLQVDKVTKLLDNAKAIIKLSNV